MTQLNKDSYAQLIKEDIHWLLEKTEDCLERQHIESILMNSIDLIYNKNERKIENESN